METQTNQPLQFVNEKSFIGLIDLNGFSVLDFNNRRKEFSYEQLQEIAEGINGHIREYRSINKFYVIETESFSLRFIEQFSYKRNKDTIRIKDYTIIHK